MVKEPWYGCQAACICTFSAYLPNIGILLMLYSVINAHSVSAQSFKMFISWLKKMLHFFKEVVLHPPDVTMLSAYFHHLPLHFTSTIEPVKERFSSNLYTLEPAGDTLYKSYSTVCSYVIMFGHFVLSHGPTRPEWDVPGDQWTHIHHEHCQNTLEHNRKPLLLL